MKSFTCININKGANNQVLSYELQDSAGKTLQVSSKKLKLMIELNKIAVVNLTLQNNEIAEDPNYQLKSMIAKIKMLGGAKEITHKSACGHEYYVMKNSDKTIVYIPDDVEYLINFDDEYVQPDFCNIYCKTLKVIGGSGLTSTFNMFYKCHAQSLDLSSFDTSKVTNMNSMFYECQAQSLDLSSFDTSKVIDMNCMFKWCKAQSIDLSSLNTSKVIRMNSMFFKCKAQSLDLSSFDTSKVTNMGGMFEDCEAQSINLSSFNTSKVISMKEMFNGCKAQSLDLSSFDTSKVENMMGMFCCCYAQSLDLSSFNTSNVTSMSSMFDGCEAQVKTTDRKILEEL